MTILSNIIIKATEPKIENPLISDDESILHCFKESKEFSLKDIIKESSDLCYEMTNEIHSKLRMDWPKMTLLFSMINEEESLPLPLLIDKLYKFKEEYNNLLITIDNSIFHLQQKIASISLESNEISIKYLMEEFKSLKDYISFLTSPPKQCCSLNPLLKGKIIIKIFSPLLALSHLTKEDFQPTKTLIEDYFTHQILSSCIAADFISTSISLNNVGIHNPPITIFKKKYTETLIKELKSSFLSLKNNLSSNQQHNSSYMKSLLEDWFEKYFLSHHNRLSIIYKELGTQFINLSLTIPLLKVIQKDFLPLFNSLDNASLFSSSYNLFLAFNMSSSSCGTSSNSTLIQILSSYQITPYCHKRTKEVMDKVSSIKEDIRKCLSNNTKMTDLMDKKLLFLIIKRDILSPYLIPLGYEGKFLRLLILAINAISDYLLESSKMVTNPENMILVSKDHLEILLLYDKILDEENNFLKCNNNFMAILDRFEKELYKRQEIISEYVYDHFSKDPQLLKWTCTTLEIDDNRIAPMGRLRMAAANLKEENHSIGQAPSSPTLPLPFEQI